jgi:hypothetical protein
MDYGINHHSRQQAMYYWFASLQLLLEIENKWIKTLRFHPEQSFFHARDGDGTRFLLLDNKLPSNIPNWTDLLMDALKQFDINFENRWFCGSFLDPV